MSNALNDRPSTPPSGSAWPPSGGGVQAVANSVYEGTCGILNRLILLAALGTLLAAVLYAHFNNLSIRKLVLNAKEGLARVEFNTIRPHRIAP